MAFEKKKLPSVACHIIFEPSNFFAESHMPGTKKYFSFFFSPICSKFAFKKMF